MTEPKAVARWLSKPAESCSQVKEIRYSAVWPPYENVSGFIVSTWEGEEFEVLVNKREKR